MCSFTKARIVAIVFARSVGSAAMYCAGVLTFDGGFMDSSFWLLLVAPFPLRIPKDIVGDAVPLSGGYFTFFAFEAERLVQLHGGAIGGKNLQLDALQRLRES